MASTPTPMTTDDAGAGLVEDGPDPDLIGNDVQVDDPAVRRRAAQVAAQAAETRASEAAAAAKAAIAAAARAAALADAAAQDAERADAAVRAAVQAESRAAAETAQRPGGARRTPGGPHDDPDDAVAADDTDAADTMVISSPVLPAPRPRPAPDGEHRRPDAGGHRRPEGAGARHSATAETTTFTAVSAAAAPGADPGSDPAGSAAAPVEPARDDAAAAPTTSRTEARRRRRRVRRPARPALVAAAVGGVLAIAGVLVAGNIVRTSPEPAAVIGATTSQEPVVPVLPSDVDGNDEEAAETLERAEVDPQSDRAVAYLEELRAAGVPTSRGGLAETEAAALVCRELDDGVDEDRIARALPASLPTVTRAEAQELVTIAQRNYCA